MASSPQNYLQPANSPILDNQSNINYFGSAIASLQLSIVLVPHSTENRYILV
ncbi:hypothetical protein [Nostoc sp.]|uniref:hypothetical protein n=1 Tax=Nostoc sp. TaxID=1180 RepID=UPI002FF4EE95